MPGEEPIVENEAEVIEDFVEAEIGIMPLAEESGAGIPAPQGISHIVGPGAD